MGLWAANDDSTSAPAFRPIGANGSANVLGTTMYENTTPGAFVAGMVAGVYGVDPTEAAVNKHVGAGWVLVKQGMGPILTLAQNAGGSGYANLAEGKISGGDINATFQVASTNSTGGVTGITLENPGRFSNTSAFSVTQPANGISAVTVNDGGSGYANGEVITFSNGAVNATGSVTTNSTGGITAVTFTSGGRGFVNATATVVAVSTANGSGANISPSIKTGSSLTLYATLGGRAGRVQYENLVAIGSIANDSDDTLFPDS